MGQRSPWFLLPLLTVFLGLVTVGSAALGESLACPGEKEVLCVPGIVANRVVCAREGDIIEFDDVTAFCVSCHDPAAKAEGERKGSNSSMGFGHAMEVEHPTGRRDFRAVGELFDAIKLTDGKVTCLSCHGGSSRYNHFISVHPRQPNLCTQCHFK